MARVALVLALVLLAGCAAQAPLAFDASAGPGEVALASAAGGLEPIRHHGERAALYALAGVAIAFVVFADLLILPFSYRRRHLFFPCSRWVWRTCR